MIERCMIGYDGDLITKFQIERQLVSQSYFEERAWGNDSLSEIMEKYERDIFIDLLSKCKNYSEIARVLQIDKATVSRKIKKYNLQS